jgi:hypothetical protein
METEIEKLSRSLLVELAGSVGFRHSPLAQQIAWTLFRPATDALARIGMTFDRNVLELGFARAMGIVLEQFASDVAVRGLATIPTEGPLLVVSNHPGTYDSLVIASQTRRDDLKFISGDIPFLRNLPHAYAHFFCIDDAGGRVYAARQAIRHLRGGGALLVYGYGHIDPDPAVYSPEDVLYHLDRWRESIDLFLRAVPETNLLIAMASHVVAAKWRNSILNRLRRDPLDRRRLVEFGQVIYQLVFPRRLKTTPRLSFAPPVSVEELRRESGTERVLPAVIARARRLLKEHMEWVTSLDG